MVTFEKKRNLRRKDTINHSGLILLGNVDVRKSFLANIHAISSKSVTQKDECIEIETGNSSLTIFNIPGLIEAEQEHINSNIVGIDKAFHEIKTEQRSEETNNQFFFTLMNELKICKDELEEQKRTVRRN